jgi:peptide/nickel transport system permease protein
VESVKNPVDASADAYTRRARARRRLLSDKFQIAIVVAVAVVLLVTVFADFFAPYDYRNLVGAPLQKPSREFLLGTDEIGRDVLSRIINGSRVSVSVGFFATVVAAAIGIPLGLAAGYFGGWTDAAAMRVTDSLLAFPPIVLAMAIVAVLGSSLGNLILAIGLVQVPRFSRLLRALTLSISQMDYVKAARVLGAGDGYILRRAILPNAMRVTLVQLSLTFATAVITEAALSFLGLGAQPPTPSWGLMLDIGRQLSMLNITYPLAAGTAIFGTVLVFTLFGDVLSDVLDPHEG